MSRVSCVIPTHNRADRLPGAIESVQNQTHSDLEIIVVNDASTDRTSEVIANYAEQDDRIKWLETENNSAQKTRNVGIDETSGEYIAFLDDDDRWHPEKTETQLRYADDYSAVSCLTRIIRPEGTEIQSHDFSGVKEYDFDDVFRGIRHFYPSGTLARAEHVQKINGFREDVVEWDFYLRLVKNFGSAAVIGQPLVDFNRENIDRLSKHIDHHITSFDVYADYKDLASRSARRQRYGNLHFGRMKTDDDISRRLYSLFLAIYFNPTNLKKAGVMLAGRGLDLVNLKEPVKKLIYGE